MGEHLHTFSFVSRIASLEEGKKIRGAWDCAAALDALPTSLVAEAVGQLAAWAAMAAVDFRRRPVAGLAGKIDLLGSVRPGQTLELEAELESVDAEAVAYGGVARADGAPIIRLQHCVGPMVPLEEFDDPQSVRNRFALLRNGAPHPNPLPIGWGEGNALSGLGLERTGNETGKWVRATLHVPQTAPFFADHFPRRAVFPGSLLMHTNLHLAATLADQLPPPKTGGWTARSVLDVKLRTFIPPGAILELEARVDECSDASAVLALESRAGKRVVATARVVFSAEGLP